MPGSEDSLLIWLPLVRAIAAEVLRSQPGRGLEFDDLVQDGCVGLLRALERFDPKRGPFEPYARRHIRGAIFDVLRERFQWERRRRPGKRCKSCDHLTVDAGGGLHCRAAACSQQTRYLETPIDDVLVVIHSEFPDHFFSAWLKAALAGLGPREKVVICEYYLHDRDWHEIAGILGLSERHVRAIHQAGLRRLRKDLERLECAQIERRSTA